MPDDLCIVDGAHEHSARGMLLPVQTTQLYEMVVVRHGLMLVGQSFSGKTSSMQVRLIWPACMLGGT